MPDTDEPTTRLAQLTPARRALLEKWKQGKSGGRAEIVPRRDAVPVPLSFQQQRLWFLHQLEPDAATYTMSVALELTGTLHIQALEQSLTLLVQRHEPLRTCFPTLNEQPFQHILPPMPLRLVLLDLSLLTADACQKEIRLLLKRQVRRSVSLAAGPLFRQSLLRLAPQRHVLILIMHHTIYDGLSLNILLRELAAFYFATLAGVSASMLPLPLNYADYAIWQRDWLQGKEQAALISYWKQQLQNTPALLELPTDRPRQPIQSHNGARLRSLISDSLISRLKSWGKQEGVTLFMVTLAAFQIVLARYSGQRDFVFGTPIANRSRPEFEPLIGFFANTLALRTTIAGNPTFRSFLQQTRSTTLEAFAHQELPFEQLVEILQPPRSLSYNPLVQVVFSLDELVVPTLEMPGLTLDIFPGDSGLSQFDLTFSLIAINNSVEINVQYNTDLFDETTISHLIEHYLHLLEAAIGNPEQRIYELPLLLESELERILFGWNEIHASY